MNASLKIKYITSAIGTLRPARNAPISIFKPLIISINNGKIKKTINIISNPIIVSPTPVVKYFLSVALIFFVTIHRQSKHNKLNLKLYYLAP